MKYFWSILGIYGRLGDLGAIDKKYDVAISTAAGSQLDTLIVDNMDTGKKCIEYLKRHDIGRINALALDKTTRHAEKVQEKFKAPENAPRLIDLISVDQPHLKTAFYQYLRDTLVAENLEQAKRIAFGAQRFRVVTLSGEVIETSGAMAGGGSQKMSGKMGQQIATKKGLLFLRFYFHFFPIWIFPLIFTIVFSPIFPQIFFFLIFSKFSSLLFDVFSPFFQFFSIFSSFFSYYIFSIFSIFFLFFPLLFLRAF